MEPAGPTVGHAARAGSDFYDSGALNVHELGDIRSPCSRPCPPPGKCLERPHGGHQRVPRQVQVACTIANMGQAGTDGCGLTRTCAVVANCHHRGTCGFAPTCRAVKAGQPPASGLIRTAAVVPIWHHRVTWASTEPSTRHWPIPAPENRPDKNGSAKLAGPYDLGKCSRPHRDYWARCRCRRRSSATRPGRPPPAASYGRVHARLSTDPEKQTGQLRSRRFGGTVRPGRTPRRPALDLPRAGLDVDLYRRPSHHDPSADPSSG